MRAFQKKFLGGITVILIFSKNDLHLIDAKTLRLQYSSNLLIAYLNINTLQNKIDTLRVITKNFPLDILCVDETKLGDNFPDHQFKIDGYQFPPFRRDRNKFVGEKIVKNDVIVKRLNDFENNISETISLDLAI